MAYLYSIASITLAISYSTTFTGGDGNLCVNYVHKNELEGLLLPLRVCGCKYQQLVFVDQFQLCSYIYF